MNYRKYEFPYLEKVYLGIVEKSRELRGIFALLVVLSADGCKDSYARLLLDDLNLVGCCMDKVKLFCFVDETGQDTYGKFFLVFAVLIEQGKKDALESVLEEVERKTGKNKYKWKNTDNKLKEIFLQEIIKIDDLKKTLFYSVYSDTKKYNYSTALTVSKVVNGSVSGDYFVTVVIDGLNKKEADLMRINLRNLGVKYKTIRGMKDEQSVFLRLADALAGFVRDYLEGESYTKKIFADVERRKLIKEV